MRKPQGHTITHSGKRVQVVLFSGASFIAKLKKKEGAFHYFYDHDKVKSNQVYQLRILPTGVNPPSYRQQMKHHEIKQLEKKFAEGKLSKNKLVSAVKKLYPSAKVTFEERK